MRVRLCLSLGYSKTIENHRHALALFVAHYNFCRIHSAHGKERKTPAQAAKLTNHVWIVEE
jgi:predicted transglutaminase-like cysteine proteinase